MRYIVCATVLTSLCAVAQEQPQKKPPLENLVVSAGRTPMDISQSGSAITVIDREQLENRGSAFLLDVLRDVPGLAVSRSGGFGATTQIRLRGSEANHVLVVIDGVEINDPSLGDAVDFAHISARNLQRVEVIRGPQSALWGSDAIGGVISIVTREAVDRLSMSGFVEGGSFSSQQAGFNISGRGDSYSYSGSMSLLDTDGVNVSRSGDEKDGYDNQTFNFKTQLNLKEDWLIGASVRRTAATTQFDPTSFVSGLPEDGDRVTEVDRTYASVFSNLASDSWNHQFELNLLDTDNRNFSDGVAGTRQSAERLTASYQGVLDFQSQSLVFAFEYEEDDFTQRGSSLFGDPNQDQIISNRGSVVEYRNNGFEPLNFALSARYDSSSAFDDVLTYRLTASYELSSETRFRLAVGSGQKRPTFTELFGFFPDQFVGNPNLEPEQSVSWEIGIDQYLGPIRGEITYFNERLEDEINGFVFDPNTFSFTAANQDGTSHRQGLEFALAGEIGGRFRYNASYTYTDADEPNGLGERIELRRPRHKASANLNFSATSNANLNLNLTYNGTQQDLFFPPFPDPSQVVDLETYLLLNIAGRWDFSPRFAVSARLENLLDEDYEEVFGFRAPGVGAYLGLHFRN